MIFSVLKFGMLLALAGNEPYLAETKVQNDLENSVSKIISREQFFVIVTSEVQIRTEKRWVEGETIEDVKEPEEPKMDLMPGFLPEPELKAKRNPPQERRTYRYIDTPQLSKLKVHVNFDDSLDPQAVLKSKVLVQNYVTQNYPTTGFVSFASIPMLKPIKEDKNASAEKKEEKKPEEPKAPEPTLEEKLKGYVLWALLGLFFLLLFYLWHKQTISETKAEMRERMREKNTPHMPQYPYNMASAFDGLKPPAPKPKRKQEEEFDSDMPEDQRVASKKKQLIHLFLAKPEAFRLYYQKLSPDDRNEMCTALRGPALDKLLEGLGLERGEVDQNDPPEVEEKLVQHSKAFDDFARAKDWQDKQFFGFLQQVPEESLKAIAGFLDPVAVCIMLRFLKPNQTASVLDSLPPDKRVEVLGSIPRLKQIPFNKILEIEKEVRAILNKMPKPLFGNQKEEVTFWGDVLIQSQNQDELYDNFEKTHPDISPKLAKFKFKLEDIAVLPEGSIKQVLGDIDNEELSKALATIADDVSDVILEALPPSRQQVLRKLRQGSQWVPKEELERAKVSVTKKFREVLK